MRWKPDSLSGARIARIDPGVRPRQEGAGAIRQAQVQRRPRFHAAVNARRRLKSEMARPVRRAVTWVVPDVVDDFPQEIPITRRELEVIETYLGALLDALEGTE
jgi:hypothetical protein